MSFNTEFALYHHVIVNVRLTVLFNTFMTHTLHVYSAKEKKKIAGIVSSVPRQMSHFLPCVR